MNAAKRTRKPKTVWLQPGEIPDPPPSFRTKVLDYIGAGPAFQKINGAGLNEELFWRKLWEFACRADDGKPQASQWYSLAGLPLHTLRRFPKKVRGWAQDIENISHKIQSSDAYGQTGATLPTFLESQVRYGVDECGSGSACTPSLRSAD